MKNTTIDRIREEIDLVDKQLLTLLNQRAGLALKTRDYKKRESIHVPKREESVLHNMVQLNAGPLNQLAVQRIYHSIMRQCRELQQHHNQTQKNQIRISIQGIRGSFSEAAALQYCQETRIFSPEIHYDTNSQKVMQALLSGTCSHGIMAINNDQGGLVEETISALSNASYKVVDTVAFLVRQNLLVNKAQALSSIKRIYSHSQAIRQCQHFIDQSLPHCEVIPVEDTALAAMHLSLGKYDTDSAVIASEQAAKKYNLIIKQQDVQTLKNNITLFLVVTRRIES